MKMEAYLPTALLRPFVKSYLIIESQEELVNRVLPGTSLAVAFRIKGQVNYLTESNSTVLPSTAISGLRKSVRLINYSKNTATLIVSFTETGANAFFKEPLHELFEESISLDNFIPQHKLSIIEEQLAETQNNNQRIAIVEQFLMSKIGNSTPDKLILNAIYRINAAKGSIKMRELAGTLYISQDAFEKRFRKIVGTSPKQFSSIIRMKSVIHQKQPTQSLTEIAFDAGYFDQPHFNKDFKLFTGQTPTDFFKSSVFW
ncbi:helix-turn-helix domain-containing protein [Runella sp.]|uniref:helix-turn-helix domain-containing protein n=1 Tax=Runella sp. TaxID=1960881 RepID=UPI003D0B89D0